MRYCEASTSLFVVRDCSAYSEECLRLEQFVVESWCWLGMLSLLSRVLEAGAALKLWLVAVGARTVCSSQT